MAWECLQCGFYLDWSQAPPECPECGATQDNLFWVNDDTDEDDGTEYADEEDELAAELAPIDDDDEDEDEDEEEHVPELGDEFGRALGNPHDSAYFQDEDE